MQAKLTFLAGAALGYVLGTRAGRGSYEKIKASAKEFWAKDAVQDIVGTVQDAIKDQAGDAVHKLVQQVAPSHGRKPESGGHSPEMAADPLDGNPLDILPEVSDEFPDNAQPGGKGPQWRERHRSDGRLPDTGK
ncbi:hypothetical protein CVS30_16355 [Arthrobacter psychrolactophilus]|uniref:YtxH domain-containing protein n=1 Tax=Arthrobacter psychrolactophilus TaxID=92442 RepID=A0A2V5IKV0_9MICC|nr:hypothetical protein [Arthrobacter psychrolactophilus]PYI37289.1 hypothetical protein CVS30_16355 [Arthrobacter psychrolactophilus]